MAISWEKRPKNHGQVGGNADFCYLPYMPRVKVTRRLHFSAGHRLHNPELSEAENREIFGLCNNPAGHGHNYGLEVTLKGEIDPKTGYVFDLKRLKQVVEASVLGDVDHANLNVDVAWMSGVIPTAENIAVEIWRRLEAELPEGMLEKVANSYEREVETAVMGMTSLIEPIMIVGMGAAVGFVVLSILLPIFEMNQLVG